jgi:hypothetical protein
VHDVQEHNRDSGAHGVGCEVLDVSRPVGDEQLVNLVGRAIEYRIGDGR